MIKKFLIFLILIVSICLAKENKPQRIVGGVTVTTSQYPYQLAIVQLISGSYFQICGASILNANYVLTAAHCFRTINQNTNQDTPLNGFFVASTSFINQIQQSKLFAITNITYHPTYSSTTVVGADRVDLAVLRVNTISYDATTQPIILARPSDIPLYAPVGGNSIVTGFGRTIGNQSDPNFGPTSNSLQAVNVPLVSLATCNAALGFSYGFPIICAGATNKDSCQGDSGGPLVVTAQGQFIQIGVVSTGTASSGSQMICGGAGQYGVYVDVSAYINFIEGITGPLPNLGTTFPPTATTVVPSTQSPSGTTSSSSSLLFPLFTFLLSSFLYFLF